jgi:hypothetical protein
MRTTERATDLAGRLANALAPRRLRCGAVTGGCGEADCALRQYPVIGANLRHYPVTGANLRPKTR